MKLFFSRNSPKNAILSNEYNHTVYEIRTPFQLVGKTTTISRSIVPDSMSRKRKHRLNDQFTQIARIKWKTFGSSRLKFQGSDVAIKRVFRKKGLGLYGRHRVFTAPDGLEYRWTIGLRAPELTLNNHSKTLVAKYHPRRRHIFRKNTKASLEVFPAGEHIVDAIVVSFVYIEQLRRKREAASQSNSGLTNF